MSPTDIFISIIIALILPLVIVYWMAGPPTRCRCGAAKQGLAAGGQPPRDGLDNYRAQSMDGPIVMLHYTDWCPHCHNMMPVFDKVAADLAGQGIAFVKHNEEKDGRTPSVMGFPTILKHHKGQTTQYTGGPNEAALKAFSLDK